MIKRKTNKNSLWLLWSKKHKDIMYKWPNHKNDAIMLDTYFNYLKFHQCDTLLKELEKRGYDLTTIRFSIRKKENKND